MCTSRRRWLGGAVAAAACGVCVAAARVASAGGGADAGAGAGADASADVEAEPIEVRVFGPRECPDSARFLELVRARTTHVRPPRPGESPTVFRVVLQVSRTSSTGWLVVEDATSASRAREVSAPSCDEVAAALALIAAVSVDPTAHAQPSEPAGTGAADAGAPPIADAAPPATAPPPAAPSPAAPASGESAAPPRGRSWGAAAGAGLEIASLVGAVGALRLEGEIADRSRTTFAPAFRLVARATTAPERTNDGVAATMQWYTAALDVCPLRVSVASRAALRPCAEIAGGVLRATPTTGAAPGAQAQSRPWASAGVSLELDVLLVGPLEISPFVGAFAPLLRESFFIGTAEAFTPPVVFVTGGLDARVRF